jgi:hypothetical protein
MKFASRINPVRRTLTVCTMLIMCLATTFSLRAQSSQLLFESFNAFPGASWSVGDANAANGSNYWGAVDSAYGGEGAYAGSYKGYCAARTPTGTNFSAVYPVNMTSFASRTLNLTGYNRANLRFWFKLPSIGAGDSWRVLMNGNTVASGSAVQTSWTESSFNLNAYAGASRTLRFEFISDASGTAEGLYLDSIEATAANATLTEGFGPILLLNYTGYVIDADASNNSPGFDREGLLLSTSVLAENFQTATTNLAYRFTYTLRDTNGTQFPVRTLGGVTNASQNFIATNTLSLGNGDRGSIASSAMLIPIGRMSHLTSYRVECEIARTSGVVISRATNGPFHFHHFTNTVSGDPSLNVIGEQSGAGLERTWMVNSSPAADTFVVTNSAVFRRYDDFADAAAGADSVPVRFDLEMRNATTDALVPLANPVLVTNVSLFNYEPLTSNPPQPRVAEAAFRIPFRPAVQLNSVDAQYRLIVRMSHTNQVEKNIRKRKENGKFSNKKTLTICLP